MKEEIDQLRGSLLISQQDKRASNEMNESLRTEMRRREEMWGVEKKSLEGRMHKLTCLSTQYQATLHQHEKEENRLRDHIERGNSKIISGGRRNTRRNGQQQEDGEEVGGKIYLSQVLSQRRGDTISTSSSMSEREALEGRLREEVVVMRGMFSTLQKEHNTLISTFNSLLEDYTDLKQGKEPEDEKEILNEEGEEVDQMLEEYSSMDCEWSENNSSHVLSFRRGELDEKFQEFKNDSQPSENDEVSGILSGDVSVYDGVWKERFEEAMRLVKEQDEVISNHIQNPPSCSFNINEQDEEEAKEYNHNLEKELEWLRDERVVLEKVLHDLCGGQPSFVQETEESGLEDEESEIKCTPSKSSPLSCTSTPRQIVSTTPFTLPSPSPQTTKLLQSLISPLRTSLENKEEEDTSLQSILEEDTSLQSILEEEELDVECGEEEVTNP